MSDIIRVQISRNNLWVRSLFLPNLLVNVLKFWNNSELHTKIDLLSSPLPPLIVMTNRAINPPHHFQAKMVKHDKTTKRYQHAGRCLMFSQHAINWPNGVYLLRVSRKVFGKKTSEIIGKLLFGWPMPRWKQITRVVALTLYLNTNNYSPLHLNILRNTKFFKFQTEKKRYQFICISFSDFVLKFDIGNGWRDCSIDPAKLIYNLFDLRFTWYRFQKSPCWQVKCHDIAASKNLTTINVLKQSNWLLRRSFSFYPGKQFNERIQSPLRFSLHLVHFRICVEVF